MDPFLNKKLFFTCAIITTHCYKAEIVICCLDIHSKWTG